MKRFFVLFAALTLVAGVAMAQPPYLGEYANEIGVFTVTDPTPENAQEMACYMGAPGQVPAYCVITNPTNGVTGEPMANIGGFEFRLEVDPPSTFVNATLHPSATNFQTAPDYYCGANVPMDGGTQATLVSLVIVAFSLDPISIYVTPVSDPTTHTIPGSLAITDYNDNFSVAEAFPVTADFGVPVFGMFECSMVVPNEDVSWGGVKTLFK